MEIRWKLFGSLVLAVIGLYLFVTFSLQRYAYLTASLNVGSASMFAPAYTMVLSIIGLILLLVGSYFTAACMLPSTVLLPKQSKSAAKAEVTEEVDDENVCTKCGTENDDGSKFCINCGKRM